MIALRFYSIGSELGRLRKVFHAAAQLLLCDFNPSLTQNLEKWRKKKSKRTHKHTLAHTKVQTVPFLALSHPPTHPLVHTETQTQRKGESSIDFAVSWLCTVCILGCPSVHVCVHRGD